MAGRGLQTPNLARNSNGFPFIQVSRTRSYMEYCMSFGILSIDKFPFPRSTLRSCPTICGTIVDCRMMCGWPPNKGETQLKDPALGLFMPQNCKEKHLVHPEFPTKNSKCALPATRKVVFPTAERNAGHRGLA